MAMAIMPCLPLLVWCLISGLSTVRGQKITSWNKTSQWQKDHTLGGFQYVDPLIGTSAGGHVFAGATLPFGMVKAVADVNNENQGGFSSDASNVIGFSHMHDSGLSCRTYFGSMVLIVIRDWWGKLPFLYSYKFASPLEFWRHVYPTRRDSTMGKTLLVVK